MSFSQDDNTASTVTSRLMFDLKYEKFPKNPPFALMDFIVYGWGFGIEIACCFSLLFLLERVNIVMGIWGIFGERKILKKN